MWKLILVQADENVTAEFANLAKNLTEARKVAKTLLTSADDGYCDTYVACYKYGEDIRYPDDDYRCFKFDQDGEFLECWMKMGTYCRIGLYVA